jgi:hypothetical protein
MRSILAVAAGYAIFALSAAVLFPFSGHRPHDQATAGFMAATIVYGIVFAAAGGYVAARVGGTAPIRHGIWVGGIIALGAAVSLVVAPGAKWSQVAALCLMAPAAAVGGLLARPSRFSRSNMRNQRG